jgi:hypothetical protein
MNLFMSLFRRFTDRLVYCEECGEPIGFIWRFGHTRWRHVECPPYAPVEAVMG